MEYNFETGIVNISAEELSGFAYYKPSVSETSSVDGGFRKSPVPANVNFSGNSGTIATPFEISGETVCLKASPDAVFTRGRTTVVQVTRIMKKLPERFALNYNTEFFALGIIAACVFCLANQVDSVDLRLNFSQADSSDTVGFERTYDISSLKRLTEALVRRILPFAQLCAEKSRSHSEDIKKLVFPYGDIRSGQHEFMLGIMKTLRKGGRLVASAPTGTGKTMAALYPSIKALGAGYIDKIFYLTGKGVTGRAADEALKLLSNGVPHLRWITLRAKEACCNNTGFNDPCYLCSGLNDVVDNGKYLPYKQRRNAALEELLKSGTSYNFDNISKCAEKYKLCVHELSLDLSEYCDVVICDYNYVYDAKSMLRRYFTGDITLKYALLVDEAHNLPDRVRSSYTAELTRDSLSEFKGYLKSIGVTDAELISASESLIAELNKVSKLCLENSSFFTDRKGEHRLGYYKAKSVPEALASSAEVFLKALRILSRQNETLRDGSRNMLSALSDFVLSVQTQKTRNGFAFLAELYDERLTVKSICLDPSEIISGMSKVSRSVIMFSATLDPIEYFTDMLGFSDAAVIKAESPFDPSNMCVTVFDGISTRYSDRKSTVYDIAEVISTVINVNPGHYFVFFPSYKYMKSVAKALLETDPDVRAVMQKHDMTFAEREKFISAFSSKKYESIVGLCVLGGAFSEGIDLAGDSLIGTIIVGAGLPGISSELNLMCEYFEEKYSDGRSYAYEYPAINRIEQAAGRVIRTASDRGVVVLVDDRLSSPDIAKRFPDFWPRVSCTSDIHTLEIILDGFWQEKSP